MLLVGAPATVASTRSLVAGLLELSPLARRRSGVAAVRAVELLMGHLHSLPPGLLLDAISFSSVGEASSDGAAAPAPGGKKADPLSPFYTAMAINGDPSGQPSASSTVSEAAAGGGMLCSLLEMMARWGCPPPSSSASSPRAWLPGVISGAVSRSLIVGEDGISALPLLGTHLFSLLRSIALLQVRVGGSGALTF